MFCIVLVCDAHCLSVDKRAGQGDCSIHAQADGDRLRQYSSPIMEGRIMNRTISTLTAAVAALALSGGAYAQNNTLATPTTVSPAAAANATNGYGTPGATNSDSGTGTGASNSTQQKSTNTSSTPTTSAFGVNNTLATPSTASPVK
jgi:hypothetical protein